MNRRTALALLSTAAASPLTLGLPAARPRPGDGRANPDLRAERRGDRARSRPGRVRHLSGGLRGRVLPLRSAGRLRREPEVRPAARRELGRGARPQVHPVPAPEERALPRRHRLQRPGREVQRRADGRQGPDADEPAPVGPGRRSRRRGRAHGRHPHQGAVLAAPQLAGPWLGVHGVPRRRREARREGHRAESGRGGTLPARVLHLGAGGRAPGLRRLLGRQAGHRSTGLQVHPRGIHADRRPSHRLGRRHRLRSGPAGRGAPQGGEPRRDRPAEPPAHGARHQPLPPAL